MANEAVWFDNFYNPIITPLFYVETLADLYKEECRGRTPEQIVGHLADKNPEMSAIVCVDHWSLRDANLQGFDVQMGRRPHVSSPLRFDVNGHQGAFLKTQKRTSPQNHEARPQSQLEVSARSDHQSPSQTRALLVGR
jgi:hypothetical protein